MDVEERKSSGVAVLELRAKAFTTIGRAWPKQPLAQGIV